MDPTGPISDDILRDEIARLEARIEELNASIERCRKISLAAQLVLAAGAVWIVLMLTRTLPAASFHIVGAIAASLGGIVLFGSNSSTWKQMAAARAAAELRRAELIDRIDLRTVDADAGATPAALWPADPRDRPTLH